MVSKLVRNSRITQLVILGQYLDHVMAALMQASQCEVDRQDFDMIDYLNQLREGCLEAYTGIIQAGFVTN